MMGAVAAERAIKTPEELLHENLRLVNFVLRRYFPTMAQDEDLAQEGSIGLWKACQSYDGRVKFSSYAVVCIKNAVLMSLRKRKQLGYALSLDAPMSEGPESGTFGDLIEDPKASAFEVELLASDFTDRLKARDRQILDLQISGLTQSEIAQRVGLSQPYVSRRIIGIRALYRKTV